MAKKTATHCSFCGRTEAQGATLLPSPIENAHICLDCIDTAASMLGLIDDDEVSEEKATIARARANNRNPHGSDTTKSQSLGNGSLPKPAEIKAFLDEYIIGQDQAKKYLSVAVYNHYKRLSQPADKNDVEIEKSNIVMVGPTGTGKTLIARTIARILDVPFTIVDATVLTQAGYVGEDIESLLTRLLQVADYDVAKAQLEGSVVNVPPQGGRKHPEQPMIAVDTKNILFICGGAFDGIEQAIAHRLNKSFVGFSTDAATRRIERDAYMSHVAPQDLKTFGLIPEIIGRLPILTHLLPLDRDALRRILTEPKNAIVRQYVKLFEMDNVKLTFQPDALDYIVDKAIEFKLGARGLRSIVETVMMNAMFDIPSSDTRELTVDAEFCARQLEAAHFDANAV